MEITGTLVLAADALLFPVEELSAELRAQVGASPGDFAVTQRRSRSSTLILDADSARLLQEFRQPSSVIEAILRHSSSGKRDPESILDAAFPMLEQLVQARLLVEPNAVEANKIEPLLERGASFAGVRIVECMQLARDSDVYRVTTPSGDSAALKLMRSPADPHTVSLFQQEALILRHLDVSVTPALLDSNLVGQPGHLLLSWCGGVDCATFASRLRDRRAFAELLRFSISILNAYAHLHARNVIHADVHPGNILAESDSVVRVIDFGCAHLEDHKNQRLETDRGGVGYFLEPEYAEALLHGQQPPAATHRGEQYSLAALLYVLISGRHALNFSLERKEMLRQIVEENPQPFPEQVSRNLPGIDAVFAQALSKNPFSRFASVKAFAGSLEKLFEGADRTLSRAPNFLKYQTAVDLLERSIEKFTFGKKQSPLSIAAPRASIFYGSAGICYSLHHIACARQDAGLLSLADLWGERAARDCKLEDAWYSSAMDLTSETVGHTSPYHTQSGVAWARAMVAYSTGDSPTQQRCLDDFVRLSSHPCTGLDLTEGRAGTLLAASHLLTLQTPGRPTDLSALRKLGVTILESIWQDLDTGAPIQACNSLPLSGVAHGWHGLLYATLCWSRAAGSVPPANCQQRLHELATLDEQSRRPAHRNVPSGPHLAPASLAGSWCSGAAGQTILWLAAYAVFKEERYLALAEEAALLTSEVDPSNGSLCCGLAGQAYALLACYRRTRQPSWLDKARILGEKAAKVFVEGHLNDDLRSPHHRPESLFKGELGVAVLAADLANPDTSSFPAFEPAF